MADHAAGQNMSRVTVYVRVRSQTAAVAVTRPFANIPGV
jgi:hypothetical protein